MESSSEVGAELRNHRDKFIAADDKAQILRRDVVSVRNANPPNQGGKLITPKNRITMLTRPD